MPGACARSRARVRNARARSLAADRTSARFGASVRATRSMCGAARTEVRRRVRHPVRRRAGDGARLRACRAAWMARHRGRMPCAGFRRCLCNADAPRQAASACACSQRVARRSSGSDFSRVRRWRCRPGKVAPTRIHAGLDAPFRTAIDPDPTLAFAFAYASPAEGTHRCFLSDPNQAPRRALWSCSADVAKPMDHRHWNAGGAAVPGARRRTVFRHPAGRPRAARRSSGSVEAVREDPVAEGCR